MDGPPRLISERYIAWGDEPHHSKECRSEGERVAAHPDIAVILSDRPLLWTGHYASAIASWLSRTIQSRQREGQDLFRSATSP